MSRPLVRALLLTSLVTCLALPASAQTDPAGVTTKPLAVEEAVALALQKNFDLQIQANATEQSKETLNISMAAFDFTLNGSVNRSFSESLSRSTTIEASSSDNTSFRAGITQPLVWTNGSLNVTTNLGRSAQEGSSINLFNPSFSNNITATLNQPLLRNFGAKAAKLNIERNKLGLNIAFINYKSQVLTLIASTENAYYSLVTAREALRIRQNSLEMAQRVFDENSARRTTGVMTDLDVLTAEYGVATARGNIIQAEKTVRDSEDALLNLINLPTFDTRPGPVKFEDYTEGAPNFAVSYKLARDYYPQTLTAEETLKQLQLDLENAKRNLRPNLDLTASYGYSARGVSTGYGDVFDNLIDDHGKNWGLGLNYSMPWGQRADKSRYRQAQLSINSQKLRLDQAEQQLIVSVRQAVRTVETNLAAVEIQAKATALAERQYQQSKARFDAGLTTSRLLLQSQDDLENARFQELSAKLTLRRAATELQRLQGTSIQKYRVQLPQ